MKGQPVNRTAYTPAEVDIAHGLALEEAARRDVPPPTPRQRYIDGLRVLASVLENNEDIPLPYHGDGTDITIHFLFGSNPREAMASAAAAIPCNWSKNARESEYGDYFDLTGTVGGLKLRLTAYREAVCKRNVIGTEEREVDEVVTPAVTKKVRKPVDIVEWDCGSLLAPRLPEAAETAGAA